MKHLLLLLLATLCLGSASAQTGLAVSQLSSCDAKVTAFLQTHSIPGATISISKAGKLIYMKGFGHANALRNEAVQPHHLFRIASVSKPITSVAIMYMIEAGQLSLSDTVFGPNGIFKNNTYFNAVNVTDNRIFDITVQHLLEHSGGWDRDVACISGSTAPYTWAINHCDPIGFPLYVSRILGESNPVSEQALIKFLMEKGVAFTPGTEYHYSNIGYLTLGKIIEEVSGVSYEDYVKTFIFNPVGICDMHLGKNLLPDKQEREGEYIGNGFRAPSCYGTGTSVSWEYGGWNLEAMDAHGGWIGTARDLVRLLVSVDKFSTKPDILSAASLTTMTTASTHNANYAKGWQVNQFNNWWHTGALDGTASLFVRTSSGYTFAIILNKRQIGSAAGNFWRDFDNLPWSCISGLGTVDNHDYLANPDQNATALSFSNVTQTSMDLSWTNGSGERRMLVVSEGQALKSFPLDGSDYTGNPIWMQGDDLGNSSYVIYNGTANSSTITGLKKNTRYFFRLFEYNKNATTGNNTLYKLCGGADESKATLNFPTAIDADINASFHISPNPCVDKLHYQLENSDNQTVNIFVEDVNGHQIKRYEQQKNEGKISVSGLSTGLYFIRIHSRDKSLVRKFIKK